MTDLVRAGKVRVIGSSTTPPSLIVEGQWVAERAGLQRFRTEQPPYSILNRGVEREVLPITEPGTDVGALDQEYTPPAVHCPHLRRRPVTERSAA